MKQTNKNKENRDGNSPTNVSDLKKVLQENLKELDERMQAAKNGLKEKHQEFLSILKDVDNKAKTAIAVAQSNSILHNKNAEKIGSDGSEVESLNRKIEELKKKEARLMC